MVVVARFELGSCRPETGLVGLGTQLRRRGDQDRAEQRQGAFSAGASFVWAREVHRGRGRVRRGGAPSPR